MERNSRMLFWGNQHLGCIINLTDETENGEAGGFSEAGKEELREALCDIAERLRCAAERI